MDFKRTTHPRRIAVVLASAGLLGIAGVGLVGSNAFARVPVRTQPKSAHAIVPSATSTPDPSNPCAGSVVGGAVPGASTAATPGGVTILQNTANASIKATGNVRIGHGVGSFKVVPLSKAQVSRLQKLAPMSGGGVATLRKGALTVATDPTVTSCSVTIDSNGTVTVTSGTGIVDPATLGVPTAAGSVTATSGDIVLAPVPASKVAK